MPLYVKDFTISFSDQLSQRKGDNPRMRLYTTALMSQRHEIFDRVTVTKRLLYIITKYADL